jgi:hypothetical protein
MSGRSTTGGDRADLVDAAAHGFPAALAPTVRSLLAGWPSARLLAAGDEPVRVDGEELCLPYRIAGPVVLLVGDGPVEQAIVACLASRHHDGFVRQQAVASLLDVPFPWVVPYVVRLVGEYVIEIVETIAAALDLQPGSPAREHCGRFVAANPALIVRTRQRAVSYWNEYHRGRFPVLRPRPNDRWATYPAFPLLDALDAAGAETDALTSADDDVIRRSLRAVVEGPFFDDTEFNTLLGLDRAAMAAVLDAWPTPAATGDRDLAVNNALDNLLGYPHDHRGAGFERLVGVSEAEVRAVFARWRRRGSSVGGSCPESEPEGGDA